MNILRKDNHFRFSAQKFMLLLLIISFSCEKNEETNCPIGNLVLDEVTIDSKNYLLTTTGEIFLKEEGNCLFYQTYFDPDFIKDNYVFLNNTIYTNIDEDQLIRVKNNLNEDFENHTNFVNLFISSLADTSDNWTDFVLQSPANPLIADYVELRKCILNNTCTFDDNRIDLVSDPVVPTNACLKFFAEAPLPSMVTSKSSIENTLLFVDKSDEIWFEADYYIDKGMPLTILDLENKWFDEAPGIRLIFMNNQHLAVELKYGGKPTYRQPAGQEVIFPIKQWVRVKVYFLMDDQKDGKIKVWQDGILIIDAQGKTLPTYNSVQTSMEVGISATGQESVIYMDNIKSKVVHN
ncbi:MAG: hypothetical protein HOP30_21095 [Cyclobacteriaceae bacterium]|nr:hypothetical protein [Cyclobacteriaceae bacterium]